MRQTSLNVRSFTHSFPCSLSFFLYSLSEMRVLSIVCLDNNGLNTILSIFSQPVLLAVLFYSQMFSLFTPIHSQLRETRLNRRIYVKAFVLVVLLLPSPLQRKTKDFSLFCCVFTFMGGWEWEAFSKGANQASRKYVCNIFSNDSCISFSPFQLFTHSKSSPHNSTSFCLSRKVSLGDNTLFYL